MEKYKEQLQIIKDNVPKVHEAGRAEGYESGKAEGFEAGRAEGFEAGRAEGFEAGRVEGIEQGKKAEYDAFWDAYQKNGNRRQYDYAFYNCWDDITYNPKYPIVATSTSGYIYATNDMTSTKVPITIDTATANYLFYACRALKTIPSIKVTSKVSTLTGWFTLCSELEEIYFTDDSEIANNVSFSACSKLTSASVDTIINALATVTTTKKLTLNTSVVAELTDEQITKIANKNWQMG